MKQRTLSLLLAAALLLALLVGCGAAAAPVQTAEPALIELPTATASEPATVTLPTAAPAETEQAVQPTKVPQATPAPTAEPLPTPAPVPVPTETPAPEGVTEDGEYTSPEEVAEYLHRFGHLPGNFITKKEAQDLGWDSSRNYVSDVAPGKSIGGDYFGNYEGLLPKGKYHECDVNYTGGRRGAERIIYGKDGSIWYTDDHYQSFRQLY